VNPESGARVQNGQQSMEIPVNSKWPKVMLMSAATSAWLIYDMTEAPDRRLRSSNMACWAARWSG
jgi:hypothetical protein